MDTAGEREGGHGGAVGGRRNDERVSVFSLLTVFLYGSLSRVSMMDTDLCEFLLLWLSEEGEAEGRALKGRRGSVWRG